MKTWAKQLEDALPDALPEVREHIMAEYCPYHVLGDDSAPELMFAESYGTECQDCWDSCDSHCRSKEFKELFGIEREDGEQNGI